MEITLSLTVRIIAATAAFILAVVYAYREHQPVMYGAAFGLLLLVLGYGFQVFDPGHDDLYWSQNLNAPGAFLLYIALGIFCSNGMLGNPVRNFISSRFILRRTRSRSHDG